MKTSTSPGLGSKMLKTLVGLTCALAIVGSPAGVHAAGNGKPSPPPPTDYPYSIRQLNTPNGADSIEAIELNESGSVAGSASFPSYEGANSPTVVTSAETVSSLGLDVNASGQVVGTLSLGDYQSRALFWENEDSLWDVEAALIDITFGGTEASARSINDLGEIVGVSTLAGRRAEQRAFIYMADTMIDLNTLAPVGKMVISHATTINNAGQILTLGKTGNAFGRYILTPTNGN